MTLAVLAPAVLALAACGGQDAAEPASSAGVADVQGLVLDVDAEGIFVSAEPVSGEWFPGFDVACLLPPLGATDGQRLVGRISGEPVVLLERHDGLLDSTRPTLRRVETSNRAALHAAAAAADIVPGSSGVETAFARAVDSATPEAAAPVQAPLPPRAQPGDERPAPLPAGAPLMAWAPADALVVRFRSVEAAYRFADLADRLAQQLAARAGDGRDHGTLRLTLHHLLLPTIWRANPGGAKGVTECALVVAPPFRVGRLRAAVVFRVVDRELHDHESRAGVAIEARPEHLWRPEGDPFPEERVRTSVRAFAGDCQVVATDAALLDEILAGPGRAVAEWTEDAVTTRHGMSARDRRRAFTLVGAPTPLWDAAAGLRREAEGARRLAERWLGLVVPPFPEKGADLVGVPSPWGRVLAMTADTDADGAMVRVRLADASAAEALASALLGTDVELSALASACHANARALVPLGLVEPRASSIAERAFVWYGWRPVCPRGGSYSVDPMTGRPSCSIHADAVDGVTEVSPPPALPVSDVTVDGTLVTFRLSIDW